MSVFETFTQHFEFNRGRTLGLLERMEREADLPAALAWRPGAGRAHIAWQLMHIGITEEIFAVERLAKGTGKFSDLWSRFQGGSTPDDQIPSADEIRQVLATGREELLGTLAGLSESQLGDIMWEARDGRKLTLLSVLQIISWHEAHHQGQAHITFNLFKAS
ncbi:DinB family protein [Lignipirellula cremea]|uniref:DinB superfamily protein n=1 Tax=Lignipirellula cremea TaxID=2528010 RepID=A0A518DN14_9BACT|nr:DinB family protein [Lignipirellula cremea]QDU93229.1 DinB superfamily protein [Lignipirellula cremea]